MLATTTFASVEDDCSSWTSFAGKKMYTISRACFESIPSQAFTTISPSQMYNKWTIVIQPRLWYTIISVQRLVCRAVYTDSIHVFGIQNQGHRLDSYKTLVYSCSNEFNENVLKSISRNQLGSIYPTTFGDIPVATFKNIPAEAFTALTKAQMYKMDYSDNNNQCAALSAEQFAEFHTRLWYTNQGHRLDSFGSVVTSSMRTS